MLKKSIGMRILAFFIDILMVFVVAVIMHFIFGFGTLTVTETGFSINLDFIEMTIASFVYFLSFAVITKGRTIGKLITKIQIKCTNLEEVNKIRIIVRELIKSLFIVISTISFVILLVHKDKKSLHDLIVDTIVIRRVKKSDFIEEN